MADESPKKPKLELLPILYVLPGASDGPKDINGKPTHGRPDVGNYKALGDHFLNKQLIEKMVVVDYDIMAESQAAAIPKDLPMPADAQEVWILVHSFGINFADALFVKLNNQIRNVKIYVYGAYSARWMFEHGFVKAPIQETDYNEYGLYNYGMLCDAPLPSMNFMGASYVGEFERAPLFQYHIESRDRAQALCPVVIKGNRHGAFGAMDKFPDSASILLASIERRFCAEGRVWFNGDDQDARDWKEEQEIKKEEALKEEAKLLVAATLT